MALPSGHSVDPPADPAPLASTSGARAVSAFAFPTLPPLQTLYAIVCILMHGQGGLQAGEPEALSAVDQLGLRPVRDRPWALALRPVRDRLGASSAAGPRSDPPHGLGVSWRRAPPWLSPGVLPV